MTEKISKTQNLCLHRSIKTSVLIMFLFLLDIGAIAYSFSFKEISLKAILLIIVEVLLSFAIFLLSKEFLSQLKLKALLLIPIGFAFGDLNYGISTYLLNKEFSESILSLTYLLPYLLGTAIQVYLSGIILKNLRKKDFTSFALSLFFIIGFFLLKMSSIYFTSPGTESTMISSFEKIHTIIFSLMDSITFGVAVISVIITESILLQLIGFGVILTNISSLEISFMLLKAKFFGLTSFELGWCIGLLLILTGVIGLRQNNNYKAILLPIKTFKISSLRGRTILFTILSLSLFLILIGFTFGNFNSIEFVSFSLINLFFIFILSVAITNILTKKLNQIIYLIKQESLQELNLQSIKAPDEIQVIIKKFIELNEAVTKEKNQILKMSSKLAHDIRAPIAAMKMICTNLEGINTIPEHVSKRDEIIKMLGMISLSVTRIASDVLNQRKKEKSTEIVEKAIVDAFRIAQAVHHQKNISIEMPDNYKSEKVLPGLTQVLTNLLNNASEASPSDSPIVLSVIPRANNLLIEIKDKGAGITEDVLNKLKSGESLTTKITGNGIGVSSMITWTKSNQIKFDINSSTLFPNNGTTVSLEIPL